MRPVTLAALALALPLLGCGPPSRPVGHNGAGADAAPICERRCSSDLRSVIDCDGQLVQTCATTDVCDGSTSSCINSCYLTEAAHSSVGCNYYATSMDAYGTGVVSETLCFAAFVANTWSTPVHISVEYRGAMLAPETFTREPVGSGPGVSYSPYDPIAGLAPGQVAILFLGGQMGAPPHGCPAVPAVAQPQIVGTGFSDSFHIVTDVPVVAYQINPYGGGGVAVTGASLLIPTSAWDTSYVAVNVSGADMADRPLNPSLNVIARDANTTVTLSPNAAVVGGAGVPSGPAGVPLAIHLNQGQYVQITQSAELTGSPVTSDKPIGLMAGQYCMRVPLATPYCDHGEQMVPPVRALGHSAVGVMYRPRTPLETETFWRIVGAVDGTALTWSTPVGGPATLSKGQSVTFETGTPFTVASQDADHPFMLFTYMTSSGFIGTGYGDPDFVLDVPPDQFLRDYVFFTDPTYPETNLVLVRGQGPDHAYHDVTLDCLGTVTGWQGIDGNYQFARVDLSTGDFQNVGSCSNGRHEMHSDAPFGLQVWGWGTPTTTSFTANVSYGYPGGMNVQPLNNVVIE
jgi:hypothetical protein